MMSTNTAGNLVYPIRPKDLERVEDWNRIARGEISAEEYQKKFSLVSQDFCQKATLLNVESAIENADRFLKKNRKQRFF